MAMEQFWQGVSYFSLWLRRMLLQKGVRVCFSLVDFIGECEFRVCYSSA